MISSGVSVVSSQVTSAPCVIGYFYMHQLAEELAAVTNPSTQCGRDI